MPERCVLALGGFLVSAVAASAAPPVPLGKADTGRSIELAAVVEGTPAEVFELWASPDGIARFFAPAAVIEPFVGGRYEIIFAPRLDPGGASQGTKGAHVLVWEPPRRLSFEWATFVTSRIEGGSQPPVVTPEERYARPYPVWVDLELEPAPEAPGQTVVRLWCRGFERGKKWDEALRYFHWNWALVLGRLAASRVPETTDEVGSRP